MKAALRIRKRNLGSRPARVSGAGAVAAGTKGAKEAARGDAAVLYQAHDYAGKPIAIEATSPTFGDDLRRAFEKNVAKARRENKKKFGSPDPQPSRR